jgi:hypothetical protein
MKGAKQKLTLDRPATYQIKVPGYLGERWSDWAGGMTITVESEGGDPPVTTLTGTVTGCFAGFAAPALLPGLAADSCQSSGRRRIGKRRKTITTKEKMNSLKKTAGILEDVKIKLSALWVALMFCSTYADVLGFYAPGNIEELISGEIAGIQMTQGLLLGMAILMAIPSIMVFLSLTLKAKANGLANDT